MNTELDTCGLSCPQPVLLIKNALMTLEKGALIVLSDSDASRENISRLAKTLGWAVTLEERESGIYALTLTK